MISDSSLKFAVWLSRQFGSKLILAHTLPDLRHAAHAASYKARIDLLSGNKGTKPGGTEPWGDGDRPLETRALGCFCNQLNSMNALEGSL